MSVTLKASFQITPQKGLAIRARIENAGTADILVLDRLWKLDKASKPMLDPALAYLFERDGSLRVLLGAAPLPRLKHALYRNVPMATRVPAGKALEREITLAPPLKEYSVYFPEVDPPSHETKIDTLAYLVVEYLVATPDLVVTPSPLDPTALQIENPVLALTAAARLIHSDTIEPVEVVRRTDEFDRLTLPGEAPEPLKLA
jgi:hypothetical protein